MNTEDRLRRASREIEHATASLTPPPIADVRRSARMRGVGVALASAAAVIVLVGGAVLLVNGGGPTTLEPAAPGETTTTETVATTPSGPLTAFQSEEIPVDWSGAVELNGSEAILASASSEQIGADLENHGLLDGGQSGVVGVLGDTSGFRGYVLYGVVQASDTCLFVEAGRYSPAIQCDSGDAALRGVSRAQLVREDGRESSLIYGRAPSGSGTVLVETESVSVWQRTKDGFFLILIPNQGNDSVWLTPYGPDGEALLEPSPVYGSGQFSPPVETAAPGDGQVSCSSSEAQAPESFENVPEDVLVTLLEVLDAAQACDYDRLESIAGDAFTASFGGGDPSELWSMEEEQGYMPMYWLVSVLNLPHGTIETENGNLYVWPAAHAHDGSWETMPEEDLAALRTLFGEDDLQEFADFGGYFGYRVGIWANGDWSFFVAGD